MSGKPWVRVCSMGGTFLVVGVPVVKLGNAMVVSRGANSWDWATYLAGGGLAMETGRYGDGNGESAELGDDEVNGRVWTRSFL